MSRGLAGLGLTVILGVGACDRPGDAPREPAVPTAGAFTHAFEADQSGYYVPVAEVRAGGWRLDHVFLGQEPEFVGWEAAGPRGAFAPVMLELVDPASPTTATETGQVHTGRVRVLPDRYAVSDDRVTFSGRSPETGVVAFEGRLDQDALASARRNLGDEAAVLTGTLTVGGTTVRNVRLRWWAGD